MDGKGLTLGEDRKNQSWCASCLVGSPSLRQKSSPELFIPKAALAYIIIGGQIVQNQAKLHSKINNWLPSSTLTIIIVHLHMDEEYIKRVILSG